MSKALPYLTMKTWSQHILNLKATSQFIAMKMRSYATDFDIGEPSGIRSLSGFTTGVSVWLPYPIDAKADLALVAVLLGQGRCS